MPELFGNRDAFYKLNKPTTTRQIPKYLKKITSKNIKLLPKF